MGRSTSLNLAPKLVGLGGTGGRGTSILGGRGAWPQNLLLKFLIEPQIFASKNTGDKYPKLCTLNFRYDPEIETFSQLLRLVVIKLPKFFLLFSEPGWTLPQILPPNLM